MIFFLSTTNKMQRYTIFFIIANALHVSGSFSAHHQELKNCKHSIWYVPGLLLPPLAWFGWFQPNQAIGGSNQAWHVPDAVFTVFELLMMGGKTARNM
jgi:drug/metabolite transporter superfamily protein YnfA